MSSQPKKTDEELALEEAEEVKEGLDNIHLEENIENLRADKQKHLLLIKRLRDVVIQQKEEQEATYNYLTLENTEKAELIKVIQNQFEVCQSEQQASELKYTSQIEQLIEKSIGDDIRTSDRIKELEHKLHVVKDYIAEKGEKDESLKKMQDIIDQERLMFADDSVKIEMRGVVERERLRKEYGVQVTTLRKEVTYQVNKKLSNKTKKALMVNSFVTKQLISQVFTDQLLFIIICVFSFIIYCISVCISVFIRVFLIFLQCSLILNS